MELNGNKKAELKDTRYIEVRRASEARNAELEATVKRVRESADEREENVARLSTRTDSIELSAAAEGASGGREELSAERIAELRASVEDGSLFDRDRLARAAERLLASE